MHLLPTVSATFDDIAEPIDLAQPPGDVTILSFADSDLIGLATAWEAERELLPSVRLVQLRDLRHPLSVDLWVDRVAAKAKVIIVRLLGGLDWWRYGVDRLSALARERGIALAILPGEDRDDPRLAEASTLSTSELSSLLSYFREGGSDNLRSLLRKLAGYAGIVLPFEVPQAVPRTGAYGLPGTVMTLEALLASMARTRPVVPVIFYRSMLLAADVAPINALCKELTSRGLEPAPLFVTSLKDKVSASFLMEALPQLNPAVIITTTAFAAAEGAGLSSPLDVCGVPILQAVVATTKRTAWEASPRGLGASDLAMHVVLPELDGRVLVGTLSFKHSSQVFGGLAFAGNTNHPEADRVGAVADRVAAWVRLQSTPRAERRLAVLLPDYPGAPGRSGYAVGLDVPASVIALLEDLRDVGYAIQDVPRSSASSAEDAGRGLRRSLVAARYISRAVERTSDRAGV